VDRHRYARLAPGPGVRQDDRRILERAAAAIEAGLDLQRLPRIRVDREPRRADRDRAPAHARRIDAGRPLRTARLDARDRALSVTCVV